MADETISATTIIHAPAEAVFAVLADPARHAAIDVRANIEFPPFPAGHLGNSLAHLADLVTA